MGNWASIAVVATAVTALATIVYTVGTFLLWRATRESLEIASRQLDHASRAARGAVLADLFRAHREIFLRLIPPDVPLTSLWTSRATITGTEPAEATKLQIAEEIFSSVLINHAAHIFHHYQSGLLHDDIWLRARNDMRDLFQNPIIRERWLAVRDFHPREFQNLVNALLKNESERV